MPHLVRTVEPGGTVLWSDIHAVVHEEVPDSRGGEIQQGWPAHFAGAQRFAGIEEGNIRIYVFEDGWFWWIPFAGDVTSVGCVLHARAVRGREGSIGALFDAMIARNTTM